jgi:hypothetical protein
MLGAGNGPMRAGSSIPSFRFPEQPAAVLGRIATYSEWRRRAEQEHAADESTVTDDIDADGAGAIIAAHIDEGEAAPEVARALLECYGVTMAAGRRVAAAEATAAAAEIGFPVAVKATHRRVGRTVGAGVALDLTDASDVESAVAAMLETLGDGASQVIVQKMVPPGLDTRVRVRDDARLGPVISVGLGGLQADAIDDEESRLAPISRSGAATMIAGTRASSALRTHGRERLADVVARVSRLAADHPEIDELDLNPVVVNEEGCWVVDARLTLCHPDQAGPSPRRLEDR